MQSKTKSLAPDTRAAPLNMGLKVAGWLCRSPAGLVILAIVLQDEGEDGGTRCTLRAPAAVPKAEVVGISCTDPVQKPQKGCFLTKINK